MATSPARRDATEALLDAAEALLVEVGYSAITVRKLADRAGVNHGLVHYYFGSMEEVFLQTLERFTARLTERQAQLYAAEVPFADKWRTAMGYLKADFDSGYQKVWFELQAMAWNNEEMRIAWRRCSVAGSTCCTPPSRSGSPSSGWTRSGSPPQQSWPW